MRQIHPVTDEAIALTVDVSTVWETKLAAMRCHATQLSSSPMMSAPPSASACSLGVNILYVPPCARLPMTSSPTFSKDIYND